MPDMTNSEVLIVGAGPVGLTLAIDLAWRGIDVTVVETRAPAAPPEPKCNHVAARTMEIFRRLGLAEKVRNAGLPVAAWRVYATAAGFYDSIGDTNKAVEYRARFDSVVRSLAKSLAPDDPLRSASLFSGALRARVFGSG